MQLLPGVLGSIKSLNLYCDEYIMPKREMLRSSHRLDATWQFDILHKEYCFTTLLQSGHVILFFTLSVTTDLSAPLSRSNMEIFCDVHHTRIKYFY